MSNQNASHEEKTKEQAQHSNDSPVLKSIRDIHDRLAALNTSRDETSMFADELYRVLRENQDTLLGLPNDYHNLSVEFSRKNCTLYACNVARIGAKKYPYSATLLADIILYGQQSGVFDICDDALVRLQAIPYIYWEWRSFVFTIDYLKDSLSRVESLAQYESNIRTAKELIVLFKKYIPSDERAYVAEAEIELEAHNTDEALKIFETAIKCVRVAPQSCLKLGDLYLELGRYDDTVRVAAIGIRATAQDQPTSSIPYFYYISALAKDALIHIKAQDNPEVGYTNRTTVLDAIMDYQIAYDLFMVQRRSEYLATIQMRRMILEVKANLIRNDDDDTSDK